MVLLGKVAFDTSMLLAVKKFKIDVFEEVGKIVGRAQFYVPQQVERELQMLEKKGEKTAVVRELMEKNSVKVEKVGAEDADAALFEMAKKGFIVATNDKELRKKVKAFGGRVIYLRKKAFLELSMAF